MTGPTILAPYNPLPWQIEPWRDTSFILLLTGSAGGGKSRLAAEKVHGYCQKYPGSTGLILRKTRQSMTNSTLLVVDRQVIGRDPRVIHYPTKSRFEYANGSILAYGGMADDEQREQIRSIGQDGAIDILWMEEATGFVEDDFNEVLARMRGKAAPWRQVILTTNPGPPSHWIYRRLIAGGKAKVYYSGARDNPHNPSDYLETLNSLTGVLGLRLRDGKWVQAEGAVYDEFSRDVHVVERGAPWHRVIAGVDEGYTNPAVILTIGLDADDRAHYIEEYYQRRALQADVVGEARRLHAAYGIEMFYADPSAAGLIAEMRSVGLPVVEANHDVRQGIQHIKARLAVAGDGKPRLTVSAGCTNTIAEFEAYQWKEGKEEPVKVNDHAMDAGRYALLTAAAGLDPAGLIGW